MKINNLIILTAILLATTINARANSSGTRGGGDMYEDRIKIIRDDIKSWVDNSGGKKLVLPDGISSSRYSKEMLVARRTSQASCVASGDVGFPVETFGRPKTCVFDSSKKLITCDFQKFLATSESRSGVGYRL